VHANCPSDSAAFAVFLRQIEAGPAHLSTFAASDTGCGAPALSISIPKQADGVARDKIVFPFSGFVQQGQKNSSVL
jgi:hypothetical protein